VLDQSLFSLSNFLLNILLARWLSPSEYGAFTVGLAILLVAATVHAALITDPMLVFGASRFAASRDSYERALLAGHFALTLPLAAVALAVGFGLQRWTSGALVPAVAGLALVAPTYLLLMLLRRVFHVRLEPRTAAIGSGIYFAATLVGVFVLARTWNASATSGFLALTLGSVAASLWLLPRSGISRAPSAPGERAAVFAVHWAFGRWALGSNLTLWARANLFYLILPLWGGLEGSAAFRALANLVLPFLQAQVSLGPLLVPALTAARAHSELEATVKQVAGWLLPFAIAYGLIMGWLGSPLADWLYAERYAEYGGLTWLLGPIPPLCAVGFLAAMALRVLERPDADFGSNAGACLTALTLGTLLTRTWGVGGAVGGWMAAELVAASLLAAAFAALRARDRVQ
jgi:O-antigen/teichoic acid export membrane protein